MNLIKALRIAQVPSVITGKQIQKISKKLFLALQFCSSTLHSSATTQASLSYLACFSTFYSPSPIPISPTHSNIHFFTLISQTSSPYSQFLRPQFPIPNSPSHSLTPIPISILSFPITIFLSSPFLPPRSPSPSHYSSPSLFAHFHSPISIFPFPHPYPFLHPHFHLHSHTSHHHFLIISISPSPHPRPHSPLPFPFSHPHSQSPILNPHPSFSHSLISPTTFTNPHFPIPVPHSYFPFPFPILPFLILPFLILLSSLSSPFSHPPSIHFPISIPSFPFSD